MKHTLGTSSVGDIAKAMRRDFNVYDEEKRGRTLILVGAGCSHSAGIPLASEIAQKLVVQLARSYSVLEQKEFDPEKALSHLIAQEHFDEKRVRKISDDEIHTDWNLVYDEIFSHHYTTPKEIRKVFSSIFAKSDGSINWAHLSIGELVRVGFISTVLTTNFDQLVLEGIARTGPLPVVADGIESLYRITGHPDYPQLIHIHGSRHTYYLRNSAEDVDSISRDHSARHAIGELFREANVCIVIGYGGRERGLMDVLIDAGKRFPDTRIFWVTRSEDMGQLSEQALELLSTSKYSSVVLGQDADDFFLQLLKNLNCCPPKIIEKPTYLMEHLRDNLVFSSNVEIANLIGRHQLKVEELEGAIKGVRDISEIKKDDSRNILKDDQSAYSPLILVVDDEFAVRRFMAKALASRGYRVLEAQNGREALDIYRSNKDDIDLILTDIVMPLMDGVNLFNAVRDEDKGTKFVFISGYASEAFVKNIRHHHEDIHFLAKPVSLRQLAEAVDEVLGLQRKEPIL